jgi:hypothetical protein
VTRIIRSLFRRSDPNPLGLRYLAVDGWRDYFTHELVA